MKGNGFDARIKALLTEMGKDVSSPKTWTERAGDLLLFLLDVMVENRVGYEMADQRCDFIC